MLLPRLRQLLFLLLTAVFMLPVLAVMASWLSLGEANGAAWEILREMSHTVLPDYLGTTLLLSALVGVGVVAVGLSSAAAVTLFDFAGRRFFEWALLLPLAMPAYVVAYAYTDFLQFSGPLQTTVRELTGWQGRVFPEVRNLGGAAWVFIFSLYPYVYLLARTALSERAAHLMEAARLLGAPMRRRMFEIALPLARPAVAAGTALALMETLADFGVSSYFGIQTFTAGIYKAWLSMDNRLAAAQLATVLLALVALLLFLERRSRQKTALCRQPWRPRGVDGGALYSFDGCPAVGRLAALRRAGAGRLCAAGAVHAATARGRLVGVVLGLIFGLDLEQCAPGCHQFGAGGGPGFGPGVQLAAPSRCAHPLGGAAGGFGLRRAGRGDRGWPAAAGGLAAGQVARERRGLPHDRHRAGPDLGLPGALLRGGAAVGAKRLCAHSRQF